MLKELSSNFVKILFTSYLPDTFHPYLTIISVLVFVTFLAYGIQATTSDVYTYANNPLTFRDNGQSKLCGDFTKGSIVYVCRNVEGKDIDTYRDISRSVAQDLHNRTN